MYKLPISLLLLFITASLTACGGGGGGSSNPSDGNTTPALVNKPPSDVNFTIPSSLSQKPQNQSARAAKQSLKTANKVVDESYAYEEFKYQLSDAEAERLSANLSFLYIESVWSEVEALCPDIDSGDACSIAGGIISVVISQEMIDKELEFNAALNWYNTAELTAIQADLQTTLGSAFVLGAISYSKVIDASYDFSLTIDLTSLLEMEIEKEIGFNIPELVIETASLDAKWSKDLQVVYVARNASVSFESFTAKSTGYIALDKTSGSITYAYKNMDDFNTLEFKTTLEQLNDNKEGIQLTSNWTEEYDSSTDTFDTKGQINTDGGYLVSKSTLVFNSVTDVFHNKESFDANGVRVSGSFCDEFNGNDCSDQSTWIEDIAFDQTFDEWASDEGSEFSEDDGFLTGEFDDFSDNIQITNLPDSVNFYVIVDASITDPSYEDTLCFGFNFNSEQQTHCFGTSATDLQNSLAVFEESFDDESFDFVYTLLPNATAQFTP